MHRIKNPEISQKTLLSQLTYDPETGLLKRATSGGGMKAGAVAGTIRKDGIITVCVLGKVYLASRVIWAIYHGYWPDFIVDHIDGNPGNNRISNLRLATSQQNQWNRKVHKNMSGHKGVAWCNQNQNWIAQLRHEGKNLVVGRYANIPEAVAAYEAKATELRGKWHRPNQVYTG